MILVRMHAQHRRKHEPLIDRLPHVIIEHHLARRRKELLVSREASLVVLILILVIIRTKIPMTAWAIVNCHKVS